MFYTGETRSTTSHGAPDQQQTITPGLRNQECPYSEEPVQTGVVKRSFH